MSDYSGPASGEDFDPEVEMTPDARPDTGQQEAASESDEEDSGGDDG